MELIQGLPVIGDPFGEVENVDLTDGHHVAVVGVDHLPESAVRLVDVGVTEVVEMEVVVVSAHVLPRSDVVGWHGWVVTVKRVLHHLMGGIDPEAVHPSVHPEPGDVEHRLDDLRVTPVEIGLLLQIG
ncbi:MAG: hypothetical protein L0177_17020, partial [Chloroflexi bacterium]|nr:hypothetical protein [Chloroflexota bacterium]